MYTVITTINRFNDPSPCSNLETGLKSVLFSNRSSSCCPLWSRSFHHARGRLHHQRHVGQEHWLQSGKNKRQVHMHAGTALTKTKGLPWKTKILTPKGKGTKDKYSGCLKSVHQKTKSVQNLDDLKTGRQHCVWNLILSRFQTITLQRWQWNRQTPKHRKQKISNF